MSSSQRSFPLSLFSSEGEEEEEEEEEEEVTSLKAEWLNIMSFSVSLRVELGMVLLCKKNHRKLYSRQLNPELGKISLAISSWVLMKLFDKFKFY